MKKITMVISIMLLMSLSVISAHSGRTDRNGGHKDNKNVSGLGSYHYHHGYGPHLHPNGVCPYAAPVKNNTPAKNNSPATTNTPTQEPKEILAESILVSQEEIILNLGENKRITATISPSNTTNKELIWKSSDNTVATVSSEKINSVKPGKCTITVSTKNGISKEIKVIVNEIFPTEIKTNLDNIDMKLTDTKRISASLSPYNASNKTISWKSSDESIVTVQNGNINPIHSGSAIITVTTSNGLEKKIPITIQKEQENTPMVVGIVTVGIIGFIIYKVKKK